MPNALEQFVLREYRSRQIPDFRVGDVVRVHHMVPDIKKGVPVLSKTAKAIKKTKTDDQGPAVRTQVFEGVVIARKHGREPGATFTVRKIASDGVGVEKIFPLYSPIITKIEIASRPTKRVRRSKLYFLRSRIGKRARRLGVGSAVEQEVLRVEPAQAAEVEEAPEEVLEDTESKTEAAEIVESELSKQEEGNVNQEEVEKD